MHLHIIIVFRYVFRKSDLKDFVQIHVLQINNEFRKLKLIMKIKVDNENYNKADNVTFHPLTQYCNFPKVLFFVFLQSTVSIEYANFYLSIYYALLAAKMCI